MNKQSEGDAPFSESVKAQLANAGLSRAELVSASPGGQPFGDAVLIFRLDGMLLRIVRDRGQVFLDVGATSAPTEFYQYGDIEVAMRWKTLDQVLAKRQPEDLGAVLARLHARLADLSDAFSGNRAELTRARLERASKERGKAFTARLRGKE
jgi:hypothetical protein